MKTFFILFGCVLFAKSFANDRKGRSGGNSGGAIIDGVPTAISYTAVTCDEWTVDIVDTCEDISYVKRNKQFFTDEGRVVQGVWYYPSETIGIKGKYGLNPFTYIQHVSPHSFKPNICILNNFKYKLDIN